MLSICNCYYGAYKIVRKDEKEENHRTITQLKTTSLEQVRFTCMLIFMLSICNCYYDANKIAKKEGKRTKLIEQILNSK